MSISGEREREKGREGGREREKERGRKGGRQKCVRACVCVHVYTKTVLLFEG